jgi:hypothetical protein
MVLGAAGWIARDVDVGPAVRQCWLRRASRREVLDAIVPTTKLVDRLTKHTLPRGANDRTARRMLLEAKLQPG